MNSFRRMFRGIGNFFKSIWSYFTNPGLLLRLFKFKGLDSLTTKFLENQTLMKIVALIAAIALVIVTHYAPEDLSTSTTTQIPSYPLTVLQNPDMTLVNSTIPSSVEVFLIGEPSQVELARMQSSFELVADLRFLDAGTHLVHVRYEDLNPQIDIRTEPSTFTVTLAPVVETTHTVEPLIVNRQLLNPDWIYTEPTLSEEKVILKGAQVVLDSVASVQATIDAQSIPEGGGDFEVPLVAFDAQMNQLTDVVIEPAQVTAHIDVYNNSKMIPFEYSSIRGNPPSGQSISTVMFEPSEAQVFGDQNVLNGISAYPLIIDLNQLNGNGEMTFPLTAPEGTFYLREQSVTARVIFQATATKVFRDVRINLLNLPSGFTIENEPTVNVTLRGAPSRLEQLSETDFSVSIDLRQLGEGEHSVQVLLEMPEFISGEVDKTSVDVEIEKIENE